MNIETLWVHINAPIATVYDFVRDARNLPRWVPFFTSVQPGKDTDTWQVDTPDGPAQFQFAKRNDFGVLDHRIWFSSGAVLSNPMRVIEQGHSSLLSFTLFQLDTMSDEQFNEDKRLVEKDLNTIRQLIEN
ncbi:SRPBCC family protein [Gilvimarinus agarilyticus]|uniref:SRPBCC family protein n=1 Tax=Gilvimarinus agarilyticus TaxID=679259 RepID=UPI000697BA7C|nr:SRPBCC family protein [Gilvimarinus agarilyticus]